MAWLPQAITTIATGLVAVVAVWLTSRLASRRAHDERTWNRKADAYSAIFEALDDFQRWYDTYLEREFDGRELSEQQSADLTESSKQARLKLARVLASQSWLLPVEIEERIRALNEALDERHESWFESVDAGAFEVRQAKKDVLLIAQRELGRPRLAG
jgi:hypothetical protein